MKKLILGHLVYLYTPIGILACTLGIILGGMWVWLGVAIFGLNIFLDTVTAQIHTSGAPTDKQGKPLGVAGVLNTMMYLQLPLFITLQIVLAWRIYQYLTGVPIETGSLFGLPIQNGITGVELIGAILAGKNAEAEAMVNQTFTCKGGGSRGGARGPWGCYQEPAT